MGQLQVKPAVGVRDLTAYQPSLPAVGIVLPLAGTERPVVDAELLQQWQAWSNALPLETLCRYPDATALEQRIATRFHVAANQVMVTAGADEAIDRAFRAVVNAGSEVIVTAPTFEMISHYAQLAGATIKRVPWEWGAYPVEAILRQVTDKTVAIVAVSPNNPTGLVASERALRQIAERVPHALLMVDMAYGEFADVDPSHHLLDLPNTLFFRTFSKAWGMPGLRVGYALGNATVLGWMRAAGGPFSVAHASIALLGKYLDEGDAQVQQYVQRIRDERSALVDVLHSIGITATPSQANFVLARHPRKEWLVAGLASLGIGVRTFPKDPSLADAVRITCPGNKDGFEHLVRALRAVMAPQAMLFDLDGVLADVSRSYRASIIATAQDYGVAISHADIAEAKSAGSANNDWELTQRLLSQRGVHAPLAEVTERFECWYQGTHDRAGLRTTETMMCTVAWLENMAQRMPLAVVTGRPRADAERFLSEHGILNLMTTLVCMEDAPLKPDPAPVQKAMQTLGIHSAWMIGDTPDDVVSARVAGVVPIGILAPGGDAELMRTSLLRSGAAQVLTALTELEALLP